MIVENGNRFLRLTNDDASRTVFADQTIKVDPSWKAVTVSARMRATNFKLGKIASQPSNEPNIIGRVDEHLYVKLFQQARIGKD